MCACMYIQGHSFNCLPLTSGAHHGTEAGDRGAGSPGGGARETAPEAGPAHREVQAGPGVPRPRESGVARRHRQRRARPLLRTPHHQGRTRLHVQPGEIGTIVFSISCKLALS
jgi:hypothetical protein